MGDVEAILKKLGELGLEDTQLIGQAVRDHLEELDDVLAYDAAKGKNEEIEALDAVLARYAPPRA
jgi:hypothetical protein